MSSIKNLKAFRKLPKKMEKKNQSSSWLLELYGDRIFGLQFLRIEKIIFRFVNI